MSGVSIEKDCLHWSNPAVLEPQPKISPRLVIFRPRIAQYEPGLTGCHFCKLVSLCKYPPCWSCCLSEAKTSVVLKRTKPPHITFTPLAVRALIKATWTYFSWRVNPILRTKSKQNKSPCTCALSLRTRDDGIYWVSAPLENSLKSTTPALGKTQSSCPRSL